MISKLEATAILQRGGIANPRRLVDLIRKNILFMELDLSGLTVLTEAASGAYVVTPVIAALAGAKHVVALTRDSHYASAAEVVAQTRALESLCGVERKVGIYFHRSYDLFAQADIVTNLGFVRPLNAEVIAAMNPTTVIPLMCEAWEFRPGDVDLEACHDRGIPVVGTNEDYPGLEVFAYSGWLCLKMLFDAQIEIHKSKIVVVSGDKFGTVIERFLLNAGVEVRLVRDLCELSNSEWHGVDALIVADYTRQGYVIGTGGDLNADELAELAPGMTVIQFAGKVDVEGVRRSGLQIYPGQELCSNRMAMTLAGLGPRPVVDLHTAGLKVGQIIFAAHSMPLASMLSRSKWNRLIHILN